MPTVTCIEDLRRLHERTAPKPLYDYVDSGSYTESTYRANSADLAALKLRQRVGFDIGRRSTEAAMVGEKVAMPVGLAPTGLSGMQWVNGEIHAARAAEKFGVPFTLPVMSICSIEDVAGATSKPFWFQLYMMRDRDFIARLIGRAKAAGCTTLIVTLDVPVLGQRHRDIVNGLSVPLKLRPKSVLAILRRPGWALRMLRAKRRNFGNVVGHVQGISNVISVASWANAQFDPTFSWAEIGWLKRQWEGKFILKGILDPEDARAAVAAGADAIIVSNHGGRQLDGAVSSIRALPAVAEAVGDRLEVWMDGGIRSGQDVLKALAMGAKATMIGRAFNFGLGALGEAGVTAALEIIRKELDVSMGLCGARKVNEIGRHILA